MKDYAWPDLYLGLRHEFTVSLTAEMILAFVALSGDDNPLHTDPALAIQAGYSGCVAHGMLTSAFYSRLVGVYMPGRRGLLHGMDLDFSAPAFAGDELSVSGEITFMSEAFHRFEVSGRIRNQDRKLLSKALIRVGLYGD